MQDFLGVGAVVFVWVWVAMMGLGLRWTAAIERLIDILASAVGNWGGKAGRKFVVRLAP